MPLAEEIEGNSPSEELQRANQGAPEPAGAETAHSPEELEKAYDTPTRTEPKSPSADEMQHHFDQPSHPGSGKGLGDVAGGGFGASGMGGSGSSFGQALRGGIQRLGKSKRKAGLIGGGALATLLVTAVIFFGTAELKLISVMKNVESHAFSRNQYSYRKRSDAWIKAAINSHYFTKDGDKINVQGLPFAEQVKQSLGFGMYSALSADGGTVHAINDPAHFGEKIITVTAIDGTEKTYRTYYQKGEARSSIGLWVDGQTDGEGWLKRKWIKHRITTITGTKWHWLDPITQPYNKAKIAMANQVAQYLIGSSSTASEMAKTLLDKLLGADQKKILDGALQNASTDEANKLLAKALVDKLAASANDVGAAIAFLALDCGINNVIEHNDIVKLAQAKAEIEYMTAYAAEQSQANQLMEGKTNGTAAGAASSLLVSAPDSSGKVHDIEQSNNIQRSNGTPVPYQPTDNCNSTTELCNSKLPANALSRTSIGNALQTVSDVTNSAGYRVIADFVPGAPGGIMTNAFCSVFNSGPIQLALNKSNKAFDFAASNTPGIDYIWGDIKKAGGDLFNSLLHTVIEPVVPPIVDAGTTGPALGSAISAGASFSAESAMGSDVGQESSPGNTPCYQKTATDQAADTSMCAPPLTPAQAVILDNAAQQDDINNFKSSSFLTQLASINTPYSALSRILTKMPSTPAEMANNMETTMMAAINPRSWISVMTSLPSWLTPKTHAGGPQDASSYVVRDNGSGYAVDQFDAAQYGYTAAQLNTPAGSLPNADRNVGCSLTAQYRKNNPNEDIPECDQFEQDPAAAGGGAGAPPPAPPGGAPAISGTRSNWVTAIKADPSITFTYVAVESDLEKTQPNGGVVDNTVALLYALSQQGFKVPVTAIRTGHSIDGSADGLHNPAGAAFDVGYVPGDPEGTKIYEWVYNNRQALHINMMIWDLPPSGYQCVGGGQPVDCQSFFGSALPEHTTHIHLGVYE